MPNKPSRRSYKHFSIENAPQITLPFQNKWPSFISFTLQTTPFPDFTI